MGDASLGSALAEWVAEGDGPQNTGSQGLGSSSLGSSTCYAGTPGPWHAGRCAGLGAGVTVAQLGLIEFMLSQPALGV